MMCFLINRHPEWTSMHNWGVFERNLRHTTYDQDVAFLVPATLENYDISQFSKKGLDVSDNEKLSEGRYLLLEKLTW